MKSATKEADSILKELRDLRDNKGVEVKEHELIDKKSNWMNNMKKNQLNKMFRRRNTIRSTLVMK